MLLRTWRRGVGIGGGWALAAGVALWGAGAARGAVIYGDPADAVLYHSDAGGATYYFGSGDNYDEVGMNGGLERAMVFVFALPERPAGERVVSAGFGDGIQYNNHGGDIDLYGLAYRADSTVTTADYYAGPLDASATLIQRDIATSGTAGGTRVSTSAAGSAALAEYLNAQYGAGAGAGDYVMLRVNRSSPGSAYSVTAFDAADLAPYLAAANSASAPAGEHDYYYNYYLNYYTPLYSPALTVNFASVPEPGCAAVLVAAGGVAGLRRRRR